MKKMVAVLLMALMVLAFTGCDLLKCEDCGEKKSLFGEHACASITFECDVCGQEKTGTKYVRTILDEKVEYCETCHELGDEIVDIIKEKLMDEITK